MYILYIHTCINVYLLNIYICIHIIYLLCNIYYIYTHIYNVYILCILYIYINNMYILRRYYIYSLTNYHAGPTARPNLAPANVPPAVHVYQKRGVGLTL